jgi:hypothetical protein
MIHLYHVILVDGDVWSVNADDPQEALAEARRQAGYEIRLDQILKIDREESEED